MNVYCGNIACISSNDGSCQPLEDFELEEDAVLMGWEAGDD